MSTPSDSQDPGSGIGWFNDDTGQWDKVQPDMPAFLQDRVLQDRAQTIRERMTADIMHELDQTLSGRFDHEERSEIVDRVADHAMFHVEHLLEEIDDLRNAP